MPVPPCITEEMIPLLFPVHKGSVYAKLIESELGSTIVDWTEVVHPFASETVTV